MHFAFEFQNQLKRNTNFKIKRFSIGIWMDLSHFITDFFEL